MDKNCHVEPIRKIQASVQQIQSADHATLAVWGMGYENCATRVRNNLLLLDGVYGVDVYLNLALAEVTYNKARVSPEVLVDAVLHAGDGYRHDYRAELVAAE